MYPAARRLTCRVPSGSSATGITPSGSPVDVPGMFHTSQYVTSRMLRWSATSGSCISSTKLCVPIGTCVHLSSGETPICPTNFAGMTPPSSNDVVVMTSGGAAGPRPPPRPCPPPCPPPPPRAASCAVAAAAPSISAMATVPNILRRMSVPLESHVIVKSHKRAGDSIDTVRDSPFAIPSRLRRRPARCRGFLFRNQPRTRTEGQVGVRPLEHDTETIPESGEIGNVHQDPEPPTNDPGELHPAEVRDGPVAPDDRQRSLVPVAERNTWLAVQRSADHPSCVRAHLVGGGGDARNVWRGIGGLGATSHRIDDGGCIADHENMRGSGNREVWLDEGAP